MEELNHSELVFLARLNEIPGATRAVPREILIDALETLQPINARDPTLGLAIRMSEWQNKWWGRLRGIARKACCPECTGCSDMQILACYEKNKGHMEK